MTPCGTSLWSLAVIIAMSAAVLIPSNAEGVVTQSVILQERQATIPVLDFNAEKAKPEYQTMSNLDALKQICIDNTRPEGLKIVFSNEQYDMTASSGDFVIDFPLILEGESFESQMNDVTETITVQDESYVEARKGSKSYLGRRFGAFGTRPILVNMPSVEIRSSNVQINGLTIVAKTDVKYVIDLFAPRGDFPTGGWAYGWEDIAITNVKITGGDVAIYVANGAGITVEHSTISNFRRKGILGDRFQPVVGHHPITVRNCYLKPQLPADFRVRGTAFDAGNDEYPFIWNHQDLRLESNLYDGVGMGYSKGANGLVRRNVFRSLRDADSEAIHLEEFSQGVEVRHNVLDFGTQAGMWLGEGKRLQIKGIYLDRVTQRVRDLRFVDNKLVGIFDMFLGGRAAYNITIQGNDFTEVSGRKATTTFLNFDYDEGSTAANDLYEMGSEAILIDDTNTGIAGRRSELGPMKIREHNADSNNLADFLRNEFIDVVQTVAPYSSGQPLEDGLKYQIIHAQTGRPLLARWNGGLQMGKVGASGSRSIWTAYLKEDYFYSFQNHGTGKYLESDRHYTVVSLLQPLLPVGQSATEENPGTERFYPFCSRTYAEILPYQAEQRIVTPLLALQKLDPNETGYEILLGGNERKTRMTFEEVDLAPDGKAAIVLEYAKQENPSGGPMIPIMPDPSDLWEFVPV